MVVPTQAPAAAERLRCARQERLGCAPVRISSVLMTSTLLRGPANSGSRRARSRQTADRTQDRSHIARVQAQFGVHSRFWRVIHHMWMQQGRAIDRVALIAPRIEQRLPFPAEDLDAER